MTAKPAIEKMKSVANRKSFDRKGGKPGEKKDARPGQDRSSRPAPRRDDAAGDVAVSKPTSHRERRRTRKKNTISFPSWNGAAARAESRSPWKNR